MDEREKARLKKQAELEAFSKGARGEGRWEQLKSLIVGERKPQEQVRLDGMVPVSSGSETLKKIQEQRRAKEAARDSMEDTSESSEPAYEPNRMEMEKFAADRGLQPDMSKNESEEQFINRLKLKMREER